MKWLCAKIPPYPPNLGASTSRQVPENGVILRSPPHPERLWQCSPKARTRGNKGREKDKHRRHLQVDIEMTTRCKKTHANPMESLNTGLYGTMLQHSQSGDRSWN